MPLAMVQIKSQYLTEAGVDVAVQALRFLVNSLGRVDGEPKVSRADLCADFVPPFPVAQCPIEAWVTRAKNVIRTTTAFALPAGALAKGTSLPGSTTSSTR